MAQHLRIVADRGNHHARHAGKGRRRVPRSEPDDRRTTVRQIPLTRTYAPGKEITVRKEGSMPVFFTAYQQAWNDKPEPAAEGFTVSTLFRKDGKPVTTLHAGERVELVATVTADSDAEYVMVEIPIPAGCSYDSKEKGDFWKETHREYYKEKVAVFCKKAPQGDVYLHCQAPAPLYGLLPPQPGACRADVLSGILWPQRDEKSAAWPRHRRPADPGKRHDGSVTIASAT